MMWFILKLMVSFFMAIGIFVSTAWAAAKFMTWFNKLPDYDEESNKGCGL